MPVSSVERPVSALRQRMLEDMAMRGLLLVRTLEDHLYGFGQLRPGLGRGYIHRGLTRTRDPVFPLRWRPACSSP
jgi:hypothetical protein